MDFAMTLNGRSSKLWRQSLTDANHWTETVVVIGKGELPPFPTVWNHSAVWAPSVGIPKIDFTCGRVITVRLLMFSQHTLLDCVQFINHWIFVCENILFTQ